MNNYANALFNNSHPINDAGGKQFKDMFDIVLDKIPCRLDFMIQQGYWVVNIEDSQIMADNSGNDINHSYYNRSILDDCDFFPEFDKTADVTPDVIEKFIKLILNHLETLTFLKSIGRFHQKNYRKKIIVKSKCSVCFDNTKTKTPCYHIVCMVCWIQIKNKTCPICRGDISFFEHEEVIEEV